MRKIDSSTLKIIACATMLIDHLAAAPFFWYLRLPDAMNIYEICRTIGRIAFPLFCFMLVEGYEKTSCYRKYLARMLVFALVSEIPFDMTFNGSFLESASQNVGFTLLLGLVMLKVLDLQQKSENRLIKWLSVLTVAAFMGLAWLMKTDYDRGGIALIAAFWLGREHPQLLYPAVLLALAYIGSYSSYIELFGCLSLIILENYDGTRGKLSRYFSYVFYPGHLLILGLICRLVYHLF